MTRRTYEIGEKVFVKNYKSWEPAIVCSFGKTWRGAPNVQVKTQGYKRDGDFVFQKSVPHTRAYILPEAEGQRLYDEQQREEDVRKQVQAEREARYDKARESRMAEHAHELGMIARRREGYADTVDYLEKHFGKFQDACTAIEQVSRKHRETCKQGAPDCRECNLALYARLALMEDDDDEA